MSDEFASPQPLPCKDQYETAALTQEHSLGDVVEPRSSLGPRFHADRLVEFDATAPPRLPHGGAGEYAPAGHGRVFAFHFIPVYRLLNHGLARGPGARY